MKPPEQPRRFSSVILGRRSFMRSPFGHRHGIGRAPSSSSGAGPSPLSRSSLAHDDLASEKGRTSEDVRGNSAASGKGVGGDGEAEVAMSVLDEKDEDAEGEGQEDGDGGRGSCKKKSSFWRPSRIPVLIRKHARSLTRSKSKAAATVDDDDNDDDDDGDDDGKKARFGKLVKKASKDVLGKGFFGGGGGGKRGWV
ncbi:hypothetical protein QBC44DRAFT_335412 [Cladorrhinum sp. PSN332]|nr:hypothetical protein QBC44DRAFT_335412 [Cladorrhinum sp. PSN332]